MTPEQAAKIVDANWCGLSKATIVKLLVRACAEERAAVKEGMTPPCPKQHHIEELVATVIAETRAKVKEECAKMCDEVERLCRETGSRWTEHQVRSPEYWEGRREQAELFAESIRSLP